MNNSSPVHFFIKRLTSFRSEFTFSSLPLFLFHLILICKKIKIFKSCKFVIKIKVRRKKSGLSEPFFFCRAKLFSLIKMLPLDCNISPARTLTRVDFPVPFLPVTVRDSLAEIFKSRFLKIDCKKILKVCCRLFRHYSFI